MIPLTLEISNFLSYREPAVLDFQGVHLACISGANGAGKSSILDAMTWALFGQSRSKSDDDLVNRSAARNDEWAEVRFTFSIEDSIYRITRRRRAGKSTMLELQLATHLDEKGSPGGWKTLTESRIRETQGAIESILRMNFDSFINASFFLQGKADEFTTKTPARRKEILAELLGINVWDTYKEKVTVRRKAQEDQLRLQDARLAEIEEELSKEPERAANVEQKKQRCEQLQQQLSAKETVLRDLRKVETAVQQHKQQLDALRTNHQRASQQLDSLQQSRRQRETELAKFQTLLDSAATIQANFANWQSLNEALQTWQKKANEYNALGRQMEPHRLTIAQEKTRLEQQITQWQKQREQAERATIEQAELQNNMSDAKIELAELDQAMGQFDTQSAALQKARAALQATQGERELWQKEATALRQEAKRIERAEVEQERLRTQASEIEKSLEALHVQLADLNERSQERISLEAELNALENEMPRHRTELDELDDKRNRLQATTEAECPLCGQPLTVAHKEQVIADIVANGKRLKEIYLNLRDRKTEIVDRLPQLKTAVSQKSQLERQQAAWQTTLMQTAAQLEEIERNVTAWRQNGRLRLDELAQKLIEKSEVAALEKEVAELENAITEKRTLEQKRQNVQQRLAHYEARCHSLQERRDAWEANGREALREAQTKLEKKQYAAEAQEALAALEKAAEAVQYDAFAHHEASEAFARLDDAPEKHQSLQKAEINRDSLRRSIESLEEQIEMQQQSVSDYAEQIERQEASLAAMTDSGAGLKTVEEEVLALREQSIQATQALGAARQQLDVLTQQRKRHEALRNEKKAMADKLKQLRLLEEACGRNGVQALLIEAAKPDIETRANELLERLTGGGMRVAFEMQREAKSKKAAKIDTFDIRIIDGAGERPYENYSGGEQFRVNFAIRLALSQILARRAGAKLQTLVIDEGFGSQDPNGRQRLIEAINTIQDDFERILVITHIEALREAFPTQIRVEKQFGGSQIAVN